MSPDGFQTGTGQRVDVLRRHAKHRHTDLVNQIEQPLGAGMKRAPVIEDDGGPDPQTRNEPVPHHPSTSREIKEAVTRLHIAVVPLFLEVFEKDPAGPMNDAFRHSGGSGRIQDVDGVIERKRFEDRLDTVVGGDKFLERDDSIRKAGIGLRHPHHRLQSGESSHDGRELFDS